MSRMPCISIDDCIGCSACCEVCPEVFFLNETLGWVQVINPAGAVESKIQEAIDICPVHCLFWEGEEVQA